MRQADEGGAHMRLAALLAILGVPAMAAISGTVVNRTTGQPQAGATVGFYKLETQFVLSKEVKTDAKGNFSIDDAAGDPNPHMIRTTYEGVGYIHMLPPGSGTTGLTLDVYNSSKQPGAAKVSKHMILFQPSGGQMTVEETYIIDNTGATAWNDPQNGELHIWVPESAGGKIDVKATAPQSMDIPADLVKGGAKEVYGVNFAIKPGQTRIDVDYEVPYTEGAPYQGKIASKDENTYLVIPDGVSIAGENLNDLGIEPKTQARLYGLQAASYSVQLTGSVAAAPAADTSSGGSADSADSGAPQAEVVMPHAMGYAGPILGLALGILALGFILLYRASGTAKESDERRRG
jgi:hypothetical protein